MLRHGKYIQVFASVFIFKVKVIIVQHRSIVLPINSISISTIRQHVPAQLGPPGCLPLLMS